MAKCQGEVVLVTGARGFLGQHVLKHLRADKTVKEIRQLDKLPDTYSENSDQESGDDTKHIKFYQKDLIDAESCRAVLRDVDVVIHCAALVTYDFPPPKSALHENNVTATENLLRLCIEEGVKRFVNCSTIEVTLQPYVRSGIIAIVVYGNESRIGTPRNEEQLIFGEYAASKLRAEKFVLQANGKTLANGKGVLHTVSLRPSFLYGEGDEKFIGKFLKIGKERGNVLFRLAGVGGKQQITYVGNAAWAFVCAKNTLRDNPESIAGLPITITDDTPIMDILRFCQKMTLHGKHQMKPSSWGVPTIISYFCGWIVEIIASFGPSFLNKLPVMKFANPKGCIEFILFYFITILIFCLLVVLDFKERIFIFWIFSGGICMYVFQRYANRLSFPDIAEERCRIHGLVDTLRSYESFYSFGLRSVLLVGRSDGSGLFLLPPIIGKLIIKF